MVQRDFGTTTNSSNIRPGIYADVSSGAPLLPHFVFARSECSGICAGSSEPARRCDKHQNLEFWPNHANSHLPPMMTYILVPMPNVEVSEWFIHITYIECAVH